MVRHARAGQSACQTAVVPLRVAAGSLADRQLIGGGPSVQPKYSVRRPAVPTPI